MSHIPKGQIVFAVSITALELRTLRNILEEEIDRNGKEYPDINSDCRNILVQLPRNAQSNNILSAEEELDMIKKIFNEDGLSSSEMLERIHAIIS